LRVDRSAIEHAITAPLEFTGAAASQITEVVDRVGKIAAEHTDAAAYRPAPIL
jgi:adenylosuccinate lyase